MAINVLVVDDSPFFRKVLSEIINEDSRFHVSGVASNGREAMDKAKQLKPDIITMDYEMPMMDGVTAVRNIMAENPLPILMLSSMTFSGAKITMDALEAGAADFMTKNFAEINAKTPTIKKHLYDTLSALTKSISFKSKTSSNNQAKRLDNPEVTSVVDEKPEKVASITDTQISPPKTSSRLFEVPDKPKVVLVGASTGGPAALMELLKDIPANFPYPIMIVQHMPENFTLAFAQRLDKYCHIRVKEAVNGDKLEPGLALIAPGGKQMIVDSKDSKRVKVTDSEQHIHYKPSVDISMASLSRPYGKNVLAIILTGMGNDGCDGARLLKKNQATVWTQTKDSCVVYGMPMAVDKEQLSNASLSLQTMSSHLQSL